METESATLTTMPSVNVQGISLLGSIEPCGNTIGVGG